MGKNELTNSAKKLAQKGGATTFKKYGKKHYKAMAAKRWAKVEQKPAK